MAGNAWAGNSWGNSAASDRSCAGRAGLPGEQPSTAADYADGSAVAVAWGLSGSDDALTAWAERRLLQELGNLGLLECNRNNGPSG